MKYLEARENTNKTYSIQFTNHFYDIFRPYIQKGGSYFNVLYRLFGMLPQDFYHYIGSTYHATFKRSNLIKDIIYVEFSDKTDVQSFIKEIEGRLNFCEKAGFFL